MGNRCNITFLEGIKVNQVICMTGRSIAKGEELFVSYGDEVDRSHWDGTGSSAEADARHDSPETGCGTECTVDGQEPQPTGAVQRAPRPDFAHALQTFAAQPSENDQANGSDTVGHDQAP
ncbi:hypothetical protein LPJ61_005545 [Coemansia biformis]|uniref:SET domain-containing protein n=1 Tax=Coemansia biformis TaxID=1286918 RepID=A0A9W8CVP5_9FUNG|nr:hypothetical protein LPJ61_005545 [Coemansia biformis]